MTVLYALSLFKVIRYNEMKRLVGVVSHKTLSTTLKELEHVEYYCLEFLNKNFYFLPDRMLIDNNLKISSLRYSEIQFLFDYVDFIEEENVPSDA